MRALAPALLLLAGCATQPAWSVLDETASARAAAGVLLSCAPEDAEVLVDGVLQGRCADLQPPAALTLADEDAHRLEVQKPGFLPYRAELIAGNARTRLTVRLSPLN